MTQPIIRERGSHASGSTERFTATGQWFSLHEWRGSGPAVLRVHHADDEAWHVLEGVLRFRFVDRTVDVCAGGTVFVPAGVAHTHEATQARYLIVLTPRLAAPIHELQHAPDRSGHPAIYRAHESELLE